MVGTTIIYDNRHTCSTRKVLKEEMKDGQRVYILRDLDNPESKQITADADMVDRMFQTQREQIRKNKYSDRAFQKTKAKAGGF